MSDKDIVTMSAEEAKRRREAGEGRTDYEQLRSLTDEEIEQAVRDDPDAPPLLTDEDLERAKWVAPGEEDLSSEEHAGNAISELRALIGRLERRERVAEAEGMQELAHALSGDRARLAGAVERLSRQQAARPKQAGA